MYFSSETHQKSRTITEESECSTMYPEMSISEVRWVVRAESEKEIKSCSVSLGEAAKKPASFSFEDLEPRKDGMSPHWPCEGVVPQQCRAHCKYTLRSLELSLNMSLLCLAKEQWRRYETP